MKKLAKNWKLLFTVCLIFGLVGCADNKKYTVDRLKKVSFKLGAMYAMQAREDKRYVKCKTLGDVAELAWLKYEEAN
jgi:predicted component of type VI protein secretion system